MYHHKGAEPCLPLLVICSPTSHFTTLHNQIFFQAGARLIFITCQNELLLAEIHNNNSEDGIRWLAKQLGANCELHSESLDSGAEVSLHPDA